MKSTTPPPATTEVKKFWIESNLEHPLFIRMDAKSDEIHQSSPAYIYLLDDVQYFETNDSIFEWIEKENKKFIFSAAATECVHKTEQDRQHDEHWEAHFTRAKLEKE